MTHYAVMTLGETMLRLTPPGFRLLDQSAALDIQVGGSESNLAVGLARLGLQVCWLSRLTNNVLGQYIAQTLARYGVDTSHVIWTEQDRVGLYFMEEGRLPRATRVLYDRRGSAMSMMRPEELPRELFTPDGARLLHLTGITPALGENAAKTTTRALEYAQAAGWLVSFDLNYRAKLWSEAEACIGCDPYMAQADILFAPLGDVRRVLGYEDEVEQVLEKLHTRYPRALVVLTLGKDGAAACDSNGRVYRQATFPAEQVDRLGGGDAFAAGFLYGYLRAPESDRVSTGLKWAAAVAALKYTIPGDMPLIEFDDAAQLVAGSTSGSIAR